MSANSRHKRCLFGQPDREQLDRELNQQLEETERNQREEFKRKYNFDTATEAPLSPSPGDKFEWELLPPKTLPGDNPDVPKTPRKVYPGRSNLQKSRTSEKPTLVNKDNSLGESSQSDSQEEIDLNQNYTGAKKRKVNKDRENEDENKKLKASKS